MLKRRFATVLALPLMCGAVSYAAEKPMPPAGEMRTDDKVEKMMTQRLSKYIGKNIYNQENKKIGDVKDVVLDGNANHVSYVVVSYGGIMGIGDKLFAVPWKAFEMKGTDPDKLYLNIPDDTLKNAPGFDDKTWPDMADAKFREQVDAFYHTNRAKKEGMAEDRRMDAAPDKEGPKDRKGLVWVRRASKVIGADVHNKADKDVGDIKDLVVDSRNGRILYAVLSYGGIMGVGDKLFAVPIEAFGTKPDDNKFVLDVTQDQLKNAPGFDDKNWPDMASAEFRDSIHGFYKVEKRQTEAKTE
jgi:sporulation protein YlmC with PRC-barrel domain